MRKKVINSDTINPRPHAQAKWLDLEGIATVEVTTAGLKIKFLNRKR
jgi:hypothetical protein